MRNSISEPKVYPGEFSAAENTIRKVERPDNGEKKNEDFIIALLGNPNTGKSTVFNALTGLRQHTGNWPGKTVTRAEGWFIYKGNRFKLIDLPGCYSLVAASPDEEIARNFILFGRPDVTVVVVDATRLERNLSLVLQVLEITNRVVVCLNLADEARRNRLKINADNLSRQLGVPVIPTAARYREGLDQLTQCISDMVSGKIAPRPHQVKYETPKLKKAVSLLVEKLTLLLPQLPNPRWIALRLLDNDTTIIEALRPLHAKVMDIVSRAKKLRKEIGKDFHERLMEDIYAHAVRIAKEGVIPPGEKPGFDLTKSIDRIVTHRVWGFPIMLLLFSLVFWITIAGANVPSGWLSALFLDTIYPFLKQIAASPGTPWWLKGLLIDGIYLATAWVVSVMLPPMAIFFPLFTLLEDFGYLPRVAFNLDRVFKKAGAHGKQSLTMMMGFGCNAAGVIAARIIDSPRERLIAIITNNFALCNGRWPTQILIATIFIGPLVPAHFAGIISAGAVLGVALLGVGLTLAVSWGLSRTVLKGEVSGFSLELPPYRPPRILKTLYTSFIDRTVFVLWRAVVFAVPAGAAIWLISNIHISGKSIAEILINFFDPIGIFIGLNGVILLAYLVAIPANEIVIPTILMLIVLVTNIKGIGEGAGVIFELDSLSRTLGIFRANGWSLLTAVNLMLFSLIHNPCSTTLYTIKKETGSIKWTLVAAFLPLILGFITTFLVAQIWKLLN
ncbi:MAG: ferrous iron transport protein B [Candidatus Aminicenantes bacterium]|jgi:ferrous iron transport protein B